MLRPDKREKIMQAAERLFASRRFHEITTDDITREAGVGKGTIYRHFRDKDDLFHQTAMRGFEELCALLEREEAREAPIRRQLAAVCERIGRFFEGRRRLFGMMQSEENRLAFMRERRHEHWRQRRKRLTDIVAAIIDRGMRRGELRRVMPADRLAALLLGMVRSRARDLCDGTDRAVDYDALVDLFLHGAAAGNGAGRRKAGRHA